MSVKKAKGGSWRYVFDAPGSTKKARRQIKAEGFKTKREAEQAEAERRLELEKQHKEEQSKKEGKPHTLGSLLSVFLADRADRLAPKTLERYRELAAYLSPELTALPIAEVTPLHLDAEWKRLLSGGGRKRTTGEPRKLAAKTVRHIAGVVSSAYGRAIYWGLCASNPVSKSEPPTAQRRKGVALTPEQQELLFSAATSPWCLGTFLRMEAATGARRGEVLALEWSDIQDGRVVIGKSLCQTKAGLVVKPTKTEGIRSVSLPPSMLAALEAHREAQAVFKREFGPDYSGDLIFANPDGTWLKPDSISASVSLLCRRLKLPGSLHTLRHSHGSHLLAAGADLATVSERLGHSSVRVTADVYTHAIRGRDDAAAAIWDEFQRTERADGKLVN